MSGPSDKARFYLENTIPQFQEFRAKNIFSDDEIKALVKKRSSFEHRILSRGCQPIEFARYAAWEIGLEKLRKKRCKRLGIKSFMHNGQAKIFNIFDRGTKKHPGDLSLWISYLEYLKSVKANKKLKIVLTAALRLHPTKSELWLYAARWSLESEINMNGAREFMIRALRFCGNCSELWIEYAKLEMIHLSKIEIRRKVLKLDKQISDSIVLDISLPHDPTFDDFKDMIPVSDLEIDSLRSDLVEATDVETEAAKDHLKTPALNGAIPLAIYDAAQKESFFCASVAVRFFDMFTSFSEVRCLSKILHHVCESMLKLYPNDSLILDCYSRQPMIGKNYQSPGFPQALGHSLERITESLEKVNDKAKYSQLTSIWINKFLGFVDLDPGIRKVLQSLLRKVDLHKSV
ncbi:U3 small nucleolar RNA-associated protein 6 [Erysiphe necator]|nr:U3 small nucleolar RNA-associated protein 6 [Erysiphe necator]